MSRNRILGIPQNTNVLPTGAGSFYNESYQDDTLCVPATAAAGTPYCTLRLNGCGGGPTSGAQPADGDVLEVCDPQGVLSLATTLVIQGRSGGIGFQLADGAGPVDSITLNSPGARRTFTYAATSGPGGVGIWAAAEASAGVPGSGMIVANLAAISALNDASILNGTEVTPATVLQPFELVKSSAATVDGITVLATLSGTGRWIRVMDPVPQWTKQFAWVVDPAIGNDENPGNADTAAGALATLAEVARRLAAVDLTGYTVQLMSNTAATDKFDFNPRFTGSGVGLPGANNATIGSMTLLGQNGATTAGAVAAGSVGVTTFGTTPSGASTVPVAASGGQQATLTAQGVAAGFWAAHLGSQVVMTSGAMAGFRAFTCKDMNAVGFAGTARLFNWWNPLGAALAGTVSVQSGLTAVTFTNPQTLPAGQLLEFANQLGVTYVLAQPLVAGTAGVLLTPFTGATNAATTAQLFAAPVSNGTLATVGQVPANGDTFIVVDGFTQFAGVYRMPTSDYTMFPSPQNLTFPATSQFLVQNTDGRATCCQFFCSFTSSAGGQGFGSFFRLDGCLLNPTAPAANAGAIICFDERLRFVAGGVLNATLCGFNTGRIEVIGAVFQGGAAGGGIKIGRGFVGFASDTSQNGGQLALFSAGNTLGMGIFDSVSTSTTNSVGEGLGVYRNGTASIDAPLYGVGNTVGAEANEGGTIIVRSTVTPVLTGTTELILAGSGTALPGLEPSAGAVLPAASALTTWANWIAGPFTRNAMSYTNGAKIIGAVSPD